MRTRSGSTIVKIITPSIEMCHTPVRGDLSFVERVLRYRSIWLRLSGLGTNTGERIVSLTTRGEPPYVSAVTGDEIFVGAGPWDPFLELEWAQANEVKASAASTRREPRPLSRRVAIVL